MYESQRLGMQGLTRANGETVLYELLVFRKSCTFQYLVAPVSLVVEERVADVAHVHAYLVRAPRFQAAFYQRDVT